MKIAFYKAFEAEDRTFFDWLIAKLDGSDTSHCEFIVDEYDFSHNRPGLPNTRLWKFEGCHAMRGGVSQAIVLQDYEGWRVYEYPETMPAIQPFRVLNGQGYDWVGMITTKLHWFPHFKNRKVCSSYMATRLGLPDPHTWGTGELEAYVASVSVRL